MIRRVAVVCVLSSLALLTPGSAGAQTNLSNLLVNLIQNDIRLAPPPPGSTFAHDTHFLPGPTQQIAPFFFNQELVGQLATFPLGSSSGGFSYTFDPALGTFQRATDSFGPAFAERALTNGRKKLTVGGNFQYSKYTSFEGTTLDNGDVQFFLRHEPIGAEQGKPAFFFEGDVIQAALKLKLSSSTTTLFANYGLTDVWDVSLALPFEHVSVDATVDATILRLATGATSTIHQFPGGGTTKSFTDSGTATGIGDILLRTKYRFLTTPGGGLAGGLDLRLPTGDAKNLLGTGAVQATFLLIGSTRSGRFAPHFNVGYAASGQGDVVNIPNEFDYRLGTEFPWKPTVSFAVDLVGRSLQKAGRLVPTDTLWTYTSAAGVAGSTTLHEFAQTTGALNLASLALGGKFNVQGNLLISANVLVALTSSGVTARVTPVIGVDYSF